MNDLDNLHGSFKTNAADQKTRDLRARSGNEPSTASRLRRPVFCTSSGAGGPLGGERYRPVRHDIWVVCDSAPIHT
jgi:hypothetical protein